MYVFVAYLWPLFCPFSAPFLLLPCVFSLGAAKQCVVGQVGPPREPASAALSVQIMQPPAWNVSAPWGYAVNWRTRPPSDWLQLVVGDTVTATPRLGADWTAVVGWAVTSGSLPAGLELDVSTGVITGVVKAIYTPATATVSMSSPAGVARTVLRVSVAQRRRPAFQTPAYTLCEGEDLAATVAGGAAEASTYIRTDPTQPGVVSLNLWSRTPLRLCPRIDEGRGDLPDVFSLDASEAPLFQLPTGLVLDPATGVVSGTPILVGSSTAGSVGPFKIVASNRVGAEYEVGQVDATVTLVLFRLYRAPVWTDGYIVKVNGAPWGGGRRHLLHGGTPSNGSDAGGSASTGPRRR